MDSGDTPTQSPPASPERRSSDPDSPTLRKRSHATMTATSVSNSNSPIDEDADQTLNSDMLQHMGDDKSNHLEDDSSHTDQVPSPEPSAPIEDFDWDQFEANYHDMLREKEAEESILYSEFEDLSQARFSLIEAKKRC